MTRSEAASLLLVDDELEFATTLAERLRLRGHNAVVAPDGESALALLRTSCFEAVVLDVMLPGMHGIDVLQRIRESPPGLPVILLTGQAGARDGIEGMKLGALAYLAKPVDLTELLELLDTLPGRGASARP